MPDKLTPGEYRQNARVDALALLRESIGDRPLLFEKLPKEISISDDLQRRPSSFEAGSSGKRCSIHDILLEFQMLFQRHHTEFGCAIVADHEGNMAFGPYCQGDQNSVQINAPLERTSFTTASGLLVYRDETIVAALHNHPDRTSFSLKDVYAHAIVGARQDYLIKTNGEVDMIQMTADSVLLNKERLENLLSLWDTYFEMNGNVRKGLSVETIDDLLRRILPQVLKLGFYSNRDSEDPSVLKMVR